jgi:histidinol-phosphate aminotransferase
MSVTATPLVRSMSAFALADLGGHDRSTLAQNESAFPPSPRAIAAGQAAIACSHLYPDPDWTVLRDTLTRVHDVPRELIVCGNGSMDLIAISIRAFAPEGSEVLSTDYAYNFATSVTAQAGAVFVKAPESEFTVSVDALLDRVTERTRIVFLCNPGNPTGTCIANAEILRLRSRLAGDILLIIDQAYGEFDHQDPRPIFDLVQRGDTVVLRTLSKAYGLAGARIGWGLFPPAVAAEIRKLQNSNGVTTASLAMAVAAVEDQDYMRGIVSATRAIRDRFAEALRQAGYSVPASHTNFVLIGFADAAHASAADSALREAGIVMRPMRGYGLPQCLRATIGPQPVMDEALRILTRLAT